MIFFGKILYLPITLFFVEMMDYYISGRKKKVGNDFVFLRYIRYYEKKVYGIFLFRWNNLKDVK